MRALEIFATSYPHNGPAMTLPPLASRSDGLMPEELGLETHAVLFDAELHPDHVLALGHGGDEAEALFDLWTISRRGRLKRGDLHIANSYQRRTGNS